MSTGKKARLPVSLSAGKWRAAYLDGYSGLLNAPTGSGKTFALFLPFLAGYINSHPDYKTRKNNGLQMLWITPLRALTNDIKKAMQEVCDDLYIPWKIATRTGDTPAAEKQALKKKLPEVLLTTPESLHLMLAQKEYPKIFKSLQVLVVDEWHELLGTKRGVQVELGLYLGSRRWPQLAVSSWQLAILSWQTLPANCQLPTANSKHGA